MGNETVYALTDAQKKEIEAKFQPSAQGTRENIYKHDIKVAMISGTSVGGVAGGIVGGAAGSTAGGVGAIPGVAAGVPVGGTIGMAAGAIVGMLEGSVRGAVVANIYGEKEIPIISKSSEASKISGANQMLHTPETHPYKMDDKGNFQPAIVPDVRPAPVKTL